MESNVDFKGQQDEHVIDLCSVLLSSFLLSPVKWLQMLTFKLKSSVISTQGSIQWSE